MTEEVSDEHLEEYEDLVIDLGQFDKLPQMVNLNRAVGVLHRDQIPLFPDWADDNFKLVAESSGISGDWRTLPYQRGIMHCFADDRIGFVGVQKSTRMGYTKVLTANLLRNAAHLKRNCISYQPSDGDAEGYDKDEITPAIAASPRIMSELRVDDVDKKDRLNTIKRKTFKSAVIHNLGGESPKNYRRLTAALVQGDEIDELPLNVGRSKNQRQGSAIRMMARALTDSPYGKQIVGSSPTVQGFSMIERVMLALNHTFRRYFPCPDCGHYQTLKFGGVDEAFGLKMVKGNPETTRYLCESPGCGSLWDYEILPDIDVDAEWRSDRYVIADSDGTFMDLETRNEVEPPKRMGMYLTSLFSHFISWPEIMDTFLEANRSAKGGDNADLITFTNHLMGETWKEDVFDYVEPTEFQQSNCIRYMAQVPDAVKIITCGIDLQGDMAHIDFVGWGEGETSWGVKYVRHVGDPDEIDFWDALYDIVSQEFSHESGEIMSAKLVCIDSGHKASRVYQFCRRDPIRLIPVKGSPAALGQKIKDFPLKRNKDRVFLTWVGGDAAQGVLRNRYLKKRKTDDDYPVGFCFWPVGEGYDKAYFKSLLADRKVKKRVKQGTIWSWEPPDGVANDCADARKYAFAGIRILQDEFNLELTTEKVIGHSRSTMSKDRYKSIKEKANRINGRV